MSKFQEDFTHQSELNNKVLGNSQIIKDKNTYNVQVTQNPDGSKTFTFLDTNLGDKIDRNMGEPTNTFYVIQYVAEMMDQDEDFFKALEYADNNDKIEFITSARGKIVVNRSDVEDYINKYIRKRDQETKDELKLNAFRANRPNYSENCESIYKCLEESIKKADDRYIIKWKTSKIKIEENESLSQFLKRMDKFFCE